MKILVGTNNLTSIRQAAYGNHIEFFYRAGKFLTDVQLILFNPSRMSIDTMRNAAVNAALECECDYLFFYDDDVLMPSDTLKKLIEADKDIVAGWTVIRGYPFNNMAFEFRGENNLTFKNDLKFGQGLVKVDAVGCSCVLIKCELLKKMSPPYFVTGPFHTEDIYFCMKAREEVPGTSIYVDTNTETEHLLGDEAVSPRNRVMRRIMELQGNPKLRETDNADRGDAYVERINAGNFTPVEEL